MCTEAEEAKIVRTLLLGPRRNSLHAPHSAFYADYLSDSQFVHLSAIERGIDPKAHHGEGLGGIGRGTQVPRPLQPYANDLGSCNGTDAGSDAKTSAVGDHVDASPVFVRFHRVVIAGAGATPARPSHSKSS